MCSDLHRYVRTDPCFWNFSWELCGTGLTSSLPACPHKFGLLYAQLITPVHSKRSKFDLPAHWLPHSKPWSDLHDRLHFYFQNRDEDSQRHDFSPHFPAWCMHVCVLHWERLFTHTTSEEINECWLYCFTCKEWTLLIHNYLQLQEICIPSCRTALLLSGALIQYDAELSVFLTIVLPQSTAQNHSILLDY